VAMARDEDVAEEPRALAHRAQHGRGRVGGQLVGGVQEQVVPEDARGAQLALVQGGAGVGGRVLGVGGRWRDKEGFGPVPELFLLLPGFEGLLSFGGGGLLLPREFLKIKRAVGGREADDWDPGSVRSPRGREGVPTVLTGVPPAPSTSACSGLREEIPNVWKDLGVAGAGAWACALSPSSPPVPTFPSV
jgi:hypothetical protein